MEYKLLRALSIVLQAGLVILMMMLLSLVIFSCKPANNITTVKSKVESEAQKDIMEQRFLNEVRKQRQSFKVLCFKKQVSNTLLKS